MSINEGDAPAFPRHRSPVMDRWVGYFGWRSTERLAEKWTWCHWSPGNCKMQRYRGQSQHWTGSFAATVVVAKHRQLRGTYNLL
jgi:hypothetical protein